VEYAVCGGAPLGERLGHFFRGAGITVLEGYGLTESSAAATVNKPGSNKIGTVGQPLPGVTIRIARDGEILLKGPTVFPGYRHDEAASAGALDHQGWLYSGDIGALDDEGFLRVTGRKKELIVTAGGTNAAPEVLEDRLRANPLVSQCMVVGGGRPYIACLVTPDPGALEFWKRQHRRPAGASPGDLAGDRNWPRRSSWRWTMRTRPCPARSRSADSGSWAPTSRKQPASSRRRSRYAATWSPRISRPTSRRFTARSARASRQAQIRTISSRQQP
jgi:long-subunit acyl-CoA synthetase (AMP-forming)